MFPIKLLGVKTNSAKSARNLGVIFDKNFTFRSHISAVCNLCFYHMRDLRRIHHHLDLDSAKLLATALVSSRLNYCNSLLYGIADIDLTRLQRAQNQLARLVQSLLHLLTVFHCFVPFTGCQWDLEHFLRSICWPTKPCMKNSPFIFTPCLPHRFLPVHWDQTMIIVCQSLGSRPLLVLELFTLVPRLFGTTSHCLSIQPFQLLPLRNIWRHISLIWPSPPPPYIPSLAMAFWCYGTVPSSLLLNTDLAVAPLSLASPGILAL